MNTSDIIYAELFAAIKSLTNFSTMLYFGPDEVKESCQVEKWLSWTDHEISLLWWSSLLAVRLSRFVNTEFILIACLPGVYRLDLLRTVSGLLQYMRLSKLVIEVASTQDVSLVHRVLSFCQQNHMLNVLLLFEDFGETHKLYSFEAYPSYRLKILEFNGNYAELYAEQGVDLKGYALRTQPDLSDPNTILSQDGEGNVQILGYVWNMLVEFARKHNASLQLSSKPMLSRRLGQIQMLDLARDGHVDIAASVQPITLRYIHRYHEYAYPVHMGSWCTMLPKENPIGIGDSYGWLLSFMTIVGLGLLWFIYELLSGHRQRLLSMAWLVLTALLAANIRGRLFSLFIAPPSLAHIDSFDELYQSKLRILGMRSEYNDYDFDIRSKYSGLFQLTDDMLELITLRNSLNTSFGYTVTNTKWLLYDQLQSHLAKPLFYFSTDLCYYQYMPFALVIPENSPHRAALDHFMLQLTQSGLFELWIHKSYEYMNQAGIMKIPQVGETVRLRSMRTQDLLKIIYAYAVGVASSLVVLTCEIVCYHTARWLYL